MEEGLHDGLAPSSAGSDEADGPPPKRRPGRPPKFIGCQVCGCSLDDARMFHKVSGRNASDAFVVCVCMHAGSLAANEQVCKARELPDLGIVLLPSNFSDSAAALHILPGLNLHALPELGSQMLCRCCAPSIRTKAKAWKSACQLPAQPPSLLTRNSVFRPPSSCSGEDLQSCVVYIPAEMKWGLAWGPTPLQCRVTHSRQSRSPAHAGQLLSSHVLSLTTLTACMPV